MAGGESRAQDRTGRLTPGKILLLLMLLALALRAAAALSRPMVQFDEAVYLRMAENLAAGLGPQGLFAGNTTSFTPLLPLMITSVALVLRDYVVSGYVVSVVFGSLILLPLYLIGKELAGRRVGLMAAAVMAVLPVYVEYTSQIYSETEYIFFMLMGVFFARHLLRGCRVPCSILAGASLGLAYLANPGALYFVVAIFLLALVTTLYKGVWRQMLKAFGLFLLFFFIFAAPYIIYLHDQTGAWTLSGKTGSMAINRYNSAHGLSFNTIEFDRDVMSIAGDGDHLKLEEITTGKGALSSYAREPLAAVRAMLRQGYDLYSGGVPALLPLWLVPLMGLGLFAAGWNRRKLAGNAYLALMMMPFFFTLSVSAITRFLMPYLALTTIWMAEGWYVLEGWGAGTLEMNLGEGWRERARGLAVWLTAALVMLPLLANTAYTIHTERFVTAQRQAGEWIRAEAGPGQRIMNADTPSVYYSGGEAVLIPYAGYDDFTAYACRQQVDYLVVTRSFIGQMRPPLARLLADGSEHRQWPLAASFESDGEQVLVFRLDGC